MGEPLFQQSAHYTPDSGHVNLGPTGRALHLQLESLLRAYKVERSRDAASKIEHNAQAVELVLVVHGEKG